MTAIVCLFSFKLVANVNCLSCVAGFYFFVIVGKDNVVVVATFFVHMFHSNECIDGLLQIERDQLIIITFPTIKWIIFSFASM